MRIEDKQQITLFLHGACSWLSHLNCAPTLRHRWRRAVTRNKQGLRPRNGKPSVLSLNADFRAVISAGGGDIEIPVIGAVNTFGHLDEAVRILAVKNDIGYVMHPN